jgi:ribosomal protein S18 acetylase RimI-like enzyme
VIVRPLVAADQRLLWDLLHISLWDPPPAPLRPREILDHPEVRIYADGWGRPGDVGVLGVNDEGRPIGGAWMRLIRHGEGLAYVDDETPQLGIAVLPEFQRRGHGEVLMLTALQAAREHGYAQVSLTVHPRNPAIALYERCGFRKADDRRTYHLMVNRLR